MTVINSPTVQTLPLFEPIRSDLQSVLDKMRTAAHLDVELDLLDEALAHVVAVGGKLIRPSLTLTVADLFCGVDQRTVSLAAGVEMLHTATLVHDDLIDNSARRRGNPTIHTLLNPASAVLLGDYLFAMAAAWTTETGNIRVVRLFADTLMTLVQGELRQIWAQFDLERANEDYFARIHGKTAKLFATACEAAAELCEQDSATVKALSEYGRLLGLAFQIVDDVLDYTGDAKRMGKPVGSDLLNGNITLPVILYLRDYDTQGMATRLFNDHHKLSQSEAEEVIRNVIVSPALERSLEEARHLVELACDQIAFLPPSDAADRLRAVGDYIVSRSI